LVEVLLAVASARYSLEYWSVPLLVEVLLAVASARYFWYYRSMPLYFA